MSVVVDARWDGDYGIGRFGREIRRRLSFAEADEHTSSRDPLHPLEIARLWRTLRFRPRAQFFYSPGFTGTFPGTGAAQLLTVWDLIHLQADDKRSLAQRSYYEAVVRPAILDAGAVMTGSRDSAARLRAWLGRKSGSVAITAVGCGISDEFLQERRLPRTTRLLIVSGTQSHKNVRPLLEAIAAVPQASADWVVSDLVGARRLTHSTGSAASVTLHQGVSDAVLADMYRRAAALMFPSLIEGFGLPPIEAMACGTPVVYAESCLAVAETCSTWSGNHAIHTPTDVAGWVDAVDQYSSPDAPQLASFDRNRYSWDSVAATVAQTLGGLIPGVRVVPPAPTTRVHGSR